jgi:hypothetical protein
MSILSSGNDMTLTSYNGHEISFWTGPDGFSQNNTQRLTIKNDGKIGIGDTTPDGTLKLDVEGQIGATEYCDENGANCVSATALGGGTSYWNRDETNGYVYPVTLTDNIGIGTNIPNSTLHVKTETGTNAEIDIQTASNTHWGIYQDETTADLNFWNGDNNVTFTDDGNVGIGINSPTSQFHLKGSLSKAITGTVTTNTTNGNVVGSTTPIATTFTTELNVGDAIKIGSEIFTIQSITDDQNLTLDSTPTSVATDVMAYIDPDLFQIDNGDSINKFVVNKSGNVGIGTSDPTKKFVVQGEGGSMSMDTTNPYWGYTFEH